MNTIETLASRNIPELLKLKTGRKVKKLADWEKRREELKKILQEEEYGYIPPKPDHLDVEVSEQVANFCAGKCQRKNLTFTVTIGEKKHSFPVVSAIPKSDKKVPAFVFINFTPAVPDKYLPSEELCDAGFAVFSFCYNDVTKDNGDFKNGIAPIFRRGRAKQTSPGKIAMWAWAAMRVMDYVQTLDEIDTENVAVVGHSRLGKTALVAGAFDERFKYVISNDSGCSGAAITRGKVGETVPVITNVFPFWFNPRYAKNAATFEERGYDQHFLLALAAPRHLMIGSAEEDLWADPASEFLSAYAASEAYKLYGYKGVSETEEIPGAKSVVYGDRVFYQHRHGTHYFSREDWGEYTKYIKHVIESEK